MADNIITWIDKIRYKVDGIEKNVFTIGSPTLTFEDVYDALDHKFSLRDLTRTLKTFFNRQGFMIYSKSTPTVYSKTMEWYHLVTVGNTSNKIDTAFDSEENNYNENYNN